MKRFLRNSNGYSLPELLITITIVGILMAIATPNFSKWALSRQVDGESKKLYLDLLLARITAIKNNNNVIVTFNAGNNSYTVHNDTDNNNAVNGTELVKTVFLIPRVRFGFFGPGVNDPDGNLVISSVTLTDGGNILTFNSRGEADNSGSVYLIPTSEFGQSNLLLRAISIVSATGNVDLWKYNQGQTPLWI